MSAIEFNQDRQSWALPAWVAAWFAGPDRGGATKRQQRRFRQRWMAKATRVPVKNCGVAKEIAAPRRATPDPCACPRRPLFGSDAAPPCSLARQLSAEQRRGRQIEKAVSHYVAPQVLDRLMADPDGLSLGGETRDVTVLFADIRGFTALAETLRDDPARLAQIMSAIMTPLTEIVLAYGGAIDKYMGDCLMAFWGAPVENPDHAGQAFDAACAMVAAMGEINRRLAALFSDGADLPTIEIGLGLNSGPCVVGNLGSQKRFDYSVLGDPVNVASRLEGLCRTYDALMLVGEETARRLGPLAGLVEIDRVALRGRSEPQAIYAPTLRRVA
jgi:class 3 adenylate cyclase